MEYEVGLLKLNSDTEQNASLVPSQLERTRVGQSLEYQLGNLKKWPPELREGRSSSIWWNFKADLLQQPTEFQRNPSKKSTIHRRVTAKGGQIRISESDSLEPHQVAEKFLGQLCETVVKQLDVIFGKNTTFSFYFSAPGYDKQEADQYRKNVRSILRKIHQHPSLEKVKFPQQEDASTEPFLYEQYGVYYYFSRCERKIDLNKPKANYLIIDIGGSTTDFAIVHLTKTGGISNAFPIHRSIQYGGKNYNERILRRVIRNQLDEEKKILALQKVEEIKLKIFENPQLHPSLPLKIGGPVSWQVSHSTLTQAFEQDWTSILSPALIEILQEASTDERISLKDETFTIDGILLAGGGSKLQVFQQKLLEAEELKPYLSQECQISTATLADPSNLASIGLSISIAERRSHLFRVEPGKHGELGVAEEVYFKILDDSRKALNIYRHRNHKKLLLLRSEFSEKNNSKKKPYHFDIPYSEFSYEITPSLPKNVTLQFRTDCNPDIQEVVVALKKPDNTGGDNPENLYFGTTVYSLSTKREHFDSTNIRIKPHFFQWLPTKKRPARCDKDDRGECNTKIDLSLLPKAIDEPQGEETIYVCVDFGMTNTSVAVLAPNRKLDQKNFQVLLSKLPDESLSPETTVAKGKLTTASEETAKPKKEKALSKSSDSQTSKGREDQVANPPAAAEPASVLIAKQSLESQRSNSNGAKEQPAAKNGASTAEEEVLSQPTIHNLSIDTSEIERTLAALGQEVKGYAEITSQLMQVFAQYLSSNTSESNPAQSPVNLSLNEDLLPNKSSQSQDSFSEYSQFIKERGYSYESTVLSAIWTQAVNNEARLTILAGPPGSGKTALVRLTAEFFNRDLLSSYSSNNYYLLEPVLPSWFSSENLLGFYNQITNSFQPTRFLRFLKYAQLHSSQNNRKFFACLDEFNLAQPEQYLAKILSVIESSDKKMIVCQETNEEIEFTPNLKLFATVNTDAASKALSPKVLDRSMLIRIIPSKSSVIAHAEFVSTKMISSKKIFGKFQEELEFLLELGYAAGSTFGYRTIDAVASYIESHPLAVAERVEDEAIETILDTIISSFFLSKLPGKNQFEEYREYTQKLKEAGERFGNNKLHTSVSIVKRISVGYPGQSAF